MWKTISIYNFYNILHQTRTMANGQYEIFSKHLFIIHQCAICTHGWMCTKFPFIRWAMLLFFSLTHKQKYNIQHTTCTWPVCRSLLMKKRFFFRSVFLFFKQYFRFPVVALSIVWFFNCNGWKVWIAASFHILK